MVLRGIQGLKLPRSGRATARLWLPGLLQADTTVPARPPNLLQAPGLRQRLDELSLQLGHAVIAVGSEPTPTKLLATWSLRLILLFGVSIRFPRLTRVCFLLVESNLAREMARVDRRRTLGALQC